MNEALDILVGGILQGAVFALVALGFALVFRVTGAVNLAQGAFVVVGALTQFTLQHRFGVPLPVAVLGSLAISGALGLLVGALIFEPALRRLPPGGMVILTSGLLTLLEGAILLVWGSQPYQLDPWSGSSAPVALFGIRVPSQSFWEFGIAAAIVTATWYVLQRTTIGRALRACAENPGAASLMGIDVRRVTIVAYAVAAVVGAVCGMVVGPVVSLDFGSATYFTISGFVSGAIGGFGSFAGAVAGGLGLGTVEQFASGYVSSLFSTTLALLLLLLILVLRPSGLFATHAPRREDVRVASGPQMRTAARLSPRTARMAALAGVLVIAGLPLVVRDQGVLTSLTITGILFVAVLGLDVLMGFAGQVSLGHAAFMAIGAYSAAIGTTRYGWPPLVALAVGVVLALICATVVSLVSVRLRGLYLALATLAFGLLVESVAVGATGFTGGPSGIPSIPHIGLGPFTAGTPLANYYLAWAVAIAGVLVLSNLLRFDFGRALRAIRTDQTAAAALGVDVARYKLIAVLIAAGFASVAGALYAFFFQYVSPEIVGGARSIEFVTMMVLGGEGTLVGPLFGVLILTVLPTVSQPLSYAKTFIEGVLLVLALMYLPAGIYGGAVGALAKLRPAAPAAASAR